MLLNDWAAELYKGYEDDPEYIAAGLMIDITDQFNARMEELGLSQRDLAKRIGRSQPYVNKLLNHGTNMTLKTLVMMAQALDLVVETPRIIPKDIYEDVYSPKMFTAVMTPKGHASSGSCPEDFAPADKFKIGGDHVPFSDAA